MMDMGTNTGLQSTLKQKAHEVERSIQRHVDTIHVEIIHVVIVISVGFLYVTVFKVENTAIIGIVLWNM